MAFVLPPSVASGLATAGSVGLQALPGLAVLGVGFTTIKLLEPRPSRWDKTKSVIKDVGEVLSVLTALGAFFAAVTGKKAGQKSMTEADLNAAVDARARELLAQKMEFDRQVDLQVAAEKKSMEASMNQLTALLAEERAAMNARISEAVSEAQAAASVHNGDEDPSDLDVPVVFRDNAAKIKGRARGPVVRKAAAAGK